MVYHFQMLVISKRFELQQRDCAQTKGLLKQFQDLIRFFKFSLRKADLWGLEGVQIFLSKVVLSRFFLISNKLKYWRKFISDF